ncbi:MAG: hypothetical protein KH625_06295, partial [Firmicutes bacterium]|nr:hypothetical protein [Bacillota bacterium]
LKRKCRGTSADSQIIAQLHRLSSLFMEILHIFSLPEIKTGKFGRKWKLGRRKCRLRRGEGVLRRCAAAGRISRLRARAAFFSCRKKAAKERHLRKGGFRISPFP